MATRHNEEVRKEIARVKREGFTKIKADLPGYEKPDPVGEQGYIPDIWASKPGKQTLREIEEESQVTSRKDQISAFRRSAAQRPRADFVLRTYRRGKPGSKRLS